MDCRQMLVCESICIQMPTVRKLGPPSSLWALWQTYESPKAILLGDGQGGASLPNARLEAPLLWAASSEREAAQLLALSGSAGVERRTILVASRINQCVGMFRSLNHTHPGQIVIVRVFRSVNYLSA